MIRLTGAYKSSSSSLTFTISILVVFGLFSIGISNAAQICAGVAREDITDYTAGPVNDPLYVKALVLKDNVITAVIITVDAVAIGELGRIKNSFLAEVRAQLKKDLNIHPSNILINASHCHGVIRPDTALLTVQAVKEAYKNVVPVNTGAGVGYENRIMENRRLKMKNGSESDVRRAYSLPRDEDVVDIGPVDPDIGLLRLDRKNGQPLAVIYNFACHPIMGIPNGGNTADFPGFSSKVIEENTGDGALAFFLQGCAGDINPVQYKHVHIPHDAESLGNMLGLSAMRALKRIQTREYGELKVVNEVIALPRGTDLEKRISSMQAEQTRLLQSLKGTSLNLKTFIPLFVQYNLSSNYPAYYSHRYLHEKLNGKDDLNRLDAENRMHIDQYIRNIQTMEQLTRIQANMNLLKMHQAQNAASGSKTIDAEIVGIRIGDFVLVTFPGEPSVEIGLNIKKQSPHKFTFVAGYSNGYIYYAPTAKQRNNSGFAQEDCDCLVAPEWQKLYEEKINAILNKLQPQPDVKSGPPPGKCSEQTYHSRWLRDVKIELDGHADEPAWKDAKVEKRFAFPWKNAPAPETRFRALCDNNNLYFNFRVSDTDIVVAERLSDEEDEVLEDRVEIYFTLDEQMNNYFCFEVDSLGRVFDYSGSYYRRFDTKWNFEGLETKATLLPDGYEIEGRFSLKSLTALGFPKLFPGVKIRCGLYRAEFSHDRSGKQVAQRDSIHNLGRQTDGPPPLEEWVSWVDPRITDPDFHIPASLGWLEIVK